MKSIIFITPQLINFFFTNLINYLFRKEKENLGLIQKKENFENQLNRKENSYENLKKERENEKHELVEKVETLK